MPARLMGLRLLFLGGCILLSLPGLAAAGWSALGAWTAWQAAETASHAALAAGDIMHASTALMVERGRVLDAVVAGEPDSEMLGRVIAESDDVLLQAETERRAADRVRAASPRQSSRHSKQGRCLDKKAGQRPRAFGAIQSSY